MSKKHRKNRHKSNASSVLKSAVGSPLQAYSSSMLSNGINIVLWPLHQLSLAALFSASIEHARACSVKAEGAFGNGVITDNSEAGERFDQLCQFGSANLLSALGLDLEVYGNAFIEVVSAGAHVLQLRHVPAITMWRTDDLKGFVQVTFDPQGNENTIFFKPAQIVHLRYACPFGGYYARPTWLAASGMMELAHAAIQYNKNFFTNRALPEYLITTTGKQLSQEQQKTITGFFNREFKGLDNSHKTLYLHLSDIEAKIEAKPLSAGLKEAEFTKLLEMSRNFIPTAHGVPPRILGIVTAGSLGGGSEVTGQMHVFNEFTLKPRQRAMLQMLHAALSSRTGIDIDSIKINSVDLTPPDVMEGGSASAGFPGLPIQMNADQNLTKQDKISKLLDLLGQM